YSGSTLTNYQVSLTMNTKIPVTNQKMLSSCQDIRVTDTSGTLLTFWVEKNTCNTTSTTIWVKIPSISSSTTLYVYYGNPHVTSTSDDHNTFSFFDDYSSPAWSTLPNMSSGGSAITRADWSAAVLSSTIYLLGGYNNGSNDPHGEMWQYDPSAGT